MRSKIFFLAAGALLTLGAGFEHFALSQSVPAADATVTSPSEVRLWFSEPANAGTVSIRVVDLSGAAAQTAEVVQDPQDSKVYSVALTRRLTAGRYTVAWRGVGDDGHAVQGNFAFTVGTAE